MIRLQKRIRLLPFVWLNISGRSLSLSFGVRGATVNTSTTGKVRTTVSARGTGLSWVRFWK